MVIEHEPMYHHAIAGASSGCLTRFICQPLDVVKIRFQLQVEPIKKHSISKYHSTIQSMKLITQEESFSALWKGHVPAQLLSIIFGTSQFYLYIIVNQYLERFQFVSEHTKTLHFCSGAFAGCFATVASFPLDTIRTRLVAQSAKHQVYTGTLHSCVEIIKTESVTGLYRGLLPTLLQIAPHAGLQFGTYELVKDFSFLPLSPENKKNTHTRNVGIINSLVAGCFAGLVAKTAVYPLDLARKRLQIQGFEHGRKGFGGFFKCSGLMDCIILTAKKEGWHGLFKGLGPSQFKAALSTALHFTFYEQSLRLIRNISETHQMTQGK